MRGVWRRRSRVADRGRQCPTRVLNTPPVVLRCVRLESGACTGISPVVWALCRRRQLIAVVGGTFRAGRSGVWGVSRRVLRVASAGRLPGRQCRASPPAVRVARLPGVPPPMFACNSPEASAAALEFTSLELQRLWASLNVQVSELHAKLFGACRPSARQRLPATLHGGNCSIRVATRRRHAGRGFNARMSQPYHDGAHSFSAAAPTPHR